MNEGCKVNFFHERDWVVTSQTGLLQNFSVWSLSCHFPVQKVSMTPQYQALQIQADQPDSHVPQSLTFLVSVTLCRSLYPRPPSTSATCSFLYTPWSVLNPFVCTHTSLHLEHISVDIGQLILRCLQESFRINMAFSCAPSRDSHRSLYISISWESVRRGETLSQLCLYPPRRP